MAVQEKVHYWKGLSLYELNWNESILILLVPDWKLCRRMCKRGCFESQQVGVGWHKKETFDVYHYDTGRGRLAF